MAHLLFEFLDFFLFSFFSLFPLMNPIGMAPLFLNMTSMYSAREKKLMARKVALNSTLLLVIVLFTGSTILKLFGLSLSYIRIAGGLLVAWSAWDALNSREDPFEKAKKQISEENQEISSITFFPLTMPLTAGAGAIAVTIALDTKIENKLEILAFFRYLGSISGIIAVSLIVWFCYSYAEDIFNRIGKAGAQAITSITSVIILAIGVEVVWQGLEPLLKGLAFK